MTPRRPGRLRRFVALRRAERWRWLEAWWSIIVAEIGLRTASRKLLRRALDVEDGREDPSLAMPIAQSVTSAAAHHLWTVTCLPRALALWRMLRRRGIPARVRIGVRRDETTLAAHAWVEVGGRPVGEPEAIDQRFLPLVERSRPTASSESPPTSAS